MYQTLYRKYRPQTFTDVYGQENVTSVLQSQAVNGKLSHAYLFCGSRGTGKTTCAKILSKVANCINLQNGNPCNECAACKAINENTAVDVVEMDAASNSGVDNIRQLCDNIMYLPVEMKKRVYIIDEVHMLSIASFNALLKTLEEPPEHVLFILATTETNKVPATILSRCQRFDFKRISSQVIVKRIMEIAKKESIALTEQAATIIAKLSDGALRDALSILEACTGLNDLITPEKLTDVLGLSNRELIFELLSFVANRNFGGCVKIIEEIHSKTADMKSVLADILKLYRDILIIKNIPSPKALVECYENEYETLEEIAKHLSKDRIFYHISVLENFIFSYDKIPSEKKSSVEITFAKLCDESLSEEIEAIRARLEALENSSVLHSNKKENTSNISTIVKEEDIPPFDIDEPIKEKEPLKKTVEADTVRKNEIPKEVKEDTPANNEFEIILKKLKVALQKEVLTAPYLPSVNFREEDTVFVVETGSFIVRILRTSGYEEIVKKHLFALTDKYSRVELRAVEESNTQDNSLDLL